MTAVQTTSQLPSPRPSPWAASARVVLACGQATQVTAWQALLRSLEDVELMATACDGESAVALAERLQPQVVLMDLALPGLNGLDATMRLAKTRPDVRVLVLSMHQNEEYVRQALSHGAWGYLLKSTTAPELVQALRSVMAGEVYLGPEVSRGIVSHYVQCMRQEALADNRLTRRQREVLQLVAQGLSSKEVARRLAVSVKTVDTHRSQLMRELGIHEVTGLVRYAMRTGLISAYG